MVNATGLIKTKASNDPVYVGLAPTCPIEPNVSRQARMSIRMVLAGGICDIWLTHEAKQLKVLGGSGSGRS